MPASSGKSDSIDALRTRDGREHTAPRGERERFIGGQADLSPQHVHRRQRGMAAQVDFHLGRGPAQRNPLPSRNRNAVSDRFMSAATACIQDASRGEDRIQTAAGFPQTAGR